METTVTPPAAPSSSKLPESANIVVDSRHDASSFFEAHKAANSPTPPAPAVVPPVEVPAATPPPKPADPASQLSQRYVPESAKAPVEPKPVAEVVPPAAASPENPEDKIELPANYSQNARQSFDAIKSTAKTLREQLKARDAEFARMQTELQQLKTGGDASELETLRSRAQKLEQENEAFSKRLMTVDLQSHPRFQAEIITPRQQALGEAKTILDAQNLSADLDSLIGKDDVAFRAGLSEIVGKLPTALDQADFATAVRNARGLKLKADQALANARDTSQALRQQSVEAQQATFDNAWKTTIGSVQGMSELSVDPTAAPEARQMVEQFNQGLRSIGANARKLALEATSTEQISKAAIKAATYDWQAQHVLPMMSRALQAREARIAELEAQLSGIRSRNPSAQMRASVGADAGQDPNKMDHKQAAEFFASRRS